MLGTGLTELTEFLNEYAHLLVAVLVFNCKNQVLKLVSSILERNTMIQKIEIFNFITCSYYVCF